MKALLIRLWRRPPLRPCPARELLELPLLPSSRWRVVARLLLLMMVLYALELWLSGHALAAPLVLLAAGTCAIARAAPGDAPRSLILGEDGKLFLRGSRESMEPMQLQPTSLRLGSHLLLVLRGSRRTVRLLLGPDNLPPHLLAALQRRLPGTGHAGTALH